MRICHGNFPVEPGVGVFVPTNTLRRLSAKANDHPETPILYLLSSRNRSGQRYFKESRHRRGHDADVESGFHLFAPEATKAGGLLVIEWSTDTCAGARLATAAELEAVRQEQQAQAQRAGSAQAISA